MIELFVRFPLDHSYISSFKLIRLVVNVAVNDTGFAWGEDVHILTTFVNGGKYLKYKILIQRAHILTCFSKYFERQRHKQK